MELLCPAGNLPALKTAIDCGADAVYIVGNDRFTHIIGIILFRLMNYLLNKSFIQIDPPPSHQPHDKTPFWVIPLLHLGEKSFY